MLNDVPFIFQCVDKGDYRDHLSTLLQKLLDPKARQSPNAELDEARISYAVRSYTCALFDVSLNYIYMYPFNNDKFKMNILNVRTC